MAQTEHRPDPEFVAHLENRLRADYRRLERLGALERRRREPGKWLRAAAYMFAGLLLGAASVTMAQRLDEAELLELLQRQAAANASIAAQRVELNRRLLETGMRDWEIGLVEASMVEPLRGNMLDAEKQLALADLDVEEIAAAGRAVQSEISAPRVGGRDFVSERLQIELDWITARAALLGPAIEFAETRVSAGVALPQSLNSLTIERERLAANADRLRESLALRQRFVAGDIGADEAELRHRLLLATMRRQIAGIALDDLQAENARLWERYEAGVISITEVNASALELLQLGAEAEMAQIEVELITQELSSGELE